MAAIRRPLAQAGVPDAADLLVWLPRLRRYARALRRNREDADDLVQDTLERAWARADLWHGVGDMRTWLFSIMHNLHVDALRRGRLDTVDLDELTPEVPVAATQGQALAVRDLDAALATLPAEQREVLLLIGLEGMAYAEVAQALLIPIGTVMSRLSRGRERLRAALDGEFARPRAPELIRVVATAPRRAAPAWPTDAYLARFSPRPGASLNF
jgi:RNA polymerase sigma factor (sigma-70 family)